MGTVIYQNRGNERFPVLKKPGKSYRIARIRKKYALNRANHTLNRADSFTNRSIKRKPCTVYTPFLHGLGDFEPNFLDDQITQLTPWLGQIPNSESDRCVVVQIYGVPGNFRVLSTPKLCERFPPHKHLRPCVLKGDPLAGFQLFKEMNQGDDAMRDPRDKDFNYETTLEQTYWPYCLDRIEGADWRFLDRDHQPVGPTLHFSRRPSEVSLASVAYKPAKIRVEVDGKIQKVPADPDLPIVRDEEGKIRRVYLRRNKAGINKDYFSRLHRITKWLAWVPKNPPRQSTGA